jgi:hypothetical protein
MVRAWGSHFSAGPSGFLLLFPSAGREPAPTILDHNGCVIYSRFFFVTSLC